MTMQDECVIVTGASGNLGSAVADLLAKRGAQVVCVDRGQHDYADLKSRHGEDRLLLLDGRDLTDKAAADKVVAEAKARFGKVTGLVNTVGGFKMGKVGDEALGQWDMMMLLNAKVGLITSAAVLPAMLEAGRGSIVHIAAQPALKAGAGQAAYAASKAALLRMVEALAAEHRKDRITANCVLPGTIDTPQNRAAMPEAKPDTFTRPEAIAELIAFLVSPAGAVVTGGAIPATMPI